MIIECQDCRKKVMLLSNNLCPSCNKDPKSFVGEKISSSPPTIKVVDPRYRTLTKRILSGIIDFLPFIVFAIYFGNYQTGNDLQWYIKTIMIGFIWQLYSIIMNIKFGGTIGKLVVGIRIMDVNEKSWPNLKQVLMRDCVWIASYLISGLLMTIKLVQGESLDPLKTNVFEVVLNWAGMGWVIAEIITAFGNNKRRAVHDLIAKTVVIVKPKGICIRGSEYSE